MKKLTTLLTAIFTTLLITSCSKNDDPSTPNDVAIQQRWIFESIIVYSNPELSGPGFPGMQGNGTDNFDFKSNGKVYTSMMGSYDSATYRVDGDRLYTNTYVSGTLSAKPDTAIIKELSASSLILVQKNDAGDYGKFSFTR